MIEVAGMIENMAAAAPATAPVSASRQQRLKRILCRKPAFGCVSCVLAKMWGVRECRHMGV